MTTTQQHDVDPFAGGDSVPSVSWKDVPAGTIVAGVVTDPPKMVQGRDFKTGQPATWPDGNPKMVVVLRLKVDGDTEPERSLWAPKPSAIFSAIAEAQRAAGGRIAAGDRLEVALTGFEPPSNPTMSPRKLFAARLTKGAASDPFAAAVQAPASTTPASPLDGWKANPVQPSAFSTPAAPAAATDPGAPPF